MGRGVDKLGRVWYNGGNKIESEVLLSMSIVVLMGMSAVGKDTVRKVLEENDYGYFGYENIVSYTSRPIRENEIDGVDYHFVSKEEFNNMIDNNEMIEYRNYETNWCGKGETWFYGIKKFEPEAEKDYVVVIDLTGAESIINYFGEENCVLIYLEAPDKVREIRARKRGSFDETEWNRRLIADYKDFSFTNLQSFMRRHNKVWIVSNTIHGNHALKEIATVIDFIAQGRLNY